MPRLFDLTPAEYYTLVAAPKARFSVALMITLKDLSLKDVIDIRYENVVDRAVSKRKRTFAYVYPYTNFESYRFQPHEVYFYEVLNKSGKTTLLNWLRRIYNNTPGESAYGRVITKPNLNGSFKRFGWLSSFLTNSLTKHGKELRLQMQIELQQYTEELKENLQTDPAAAWDLANNLNGFLYLIPPSDLEEIIFILSNQNETILSSNYSEQIYAWFLEMDKLRDFDSYYQKAVKLVNYRGTSNKTGGISDWI